jgi:DNA adenine methylase
MRSLFRYPGGKHKLLNHILKSVGSALVDREYREPFFGGGSVGINVVKKFQPTKIWINDFDTALADLWTMVMNEPDLLKDAVNQFTPSVEAFYAFKKLLSGDISDVSAAERGFMKLAIHQMSYSGLGTMAGGPIGGKTQTSKYPVGCRWSPNNICKQTDKIHELFASTTIHHGSCTALDYRELIEKPGSAFLYLDPPYYDQGAKLYQYGFGVQQHIEMRDLLQASKNPWVLSYDDDPNIIDMYVDWADIKRIENVNYSITAIRDRETGETSSRTKTELLITNRNT